MRIKRITYVATVAMVAVLLAGWSCQNSYAKAGNLAKDVAASILVAQQVEIQAHKAGFVDNALHQSIQQELLSMADAGVRLDAAINQAHSASGAVAEIKVVNSLLQDLSQNKLAGIKDQNTQIALKAALLTVQTTLDNLAAFGGK